MQLLSPTQVARCIVQGWPYTPDTLAICSWVAAEDGDASALAVLTAPSRAPATSGAAAWATSSNQNAFPASNHNRGGQGEHSTVSSSWQCRTSMPDCAVCCCQHLRLSGLGGLCKWCSTTCLLWMWVCTRPCCVTCKEYQTLLLVLQGQWPQVEAASRTVMAMLTACQSCPCQGQCQARVMHSTAWVQQTPHSTILGLGHGP